MTGHATRKLTDDERRRLAEALADNAYNPMTGHEVRELDRKAAHITSDAPEDIAALAETVQNINTADATGTITVAAALAETVREINAGAVTVGMTIHNRDTGAMERYDGEHWVPLSFAAENAEIDAQYERVRQGAVALSVAAADFLRGVGTGGELRGVILDLDGELARFNELRAMHDDR